MSLNFKNIEPYLQFILLDGARLGSEIETARRIGTISAPLYRNRDGEKPQNHEPFLMRAGSQSEFTQWLWENGWGKSWGVFVNSNATMEELHNHFRHFLIVKDEDNRKLYFRFYDPRVLRVFLPTCSSQQLRELFDVVIESFVMEDEDATKALVFSFENNKLHREVIDLTKDNVEPPQRKKKSWETDDVIV